MLSEADSLRLAIELVGIPVSDDAIADWLESGITEDDAIRLEQLTSGAVTAEMLRPDVFK